MLAELDREPPGSWCVPGLRVEILGEWAGGAERRDRSDGEKKQVDLA